MRCVLWDQLWIVEFRAGEQVRRSGALSSLRAKPLLVRSIEIERTRDLCHSMHSVVNEAAVSDENGFVLFEVDPGQTGVSHITEVGGSPVSWIKLDDYTIIVQRSWNVST